MPETKQADNRHMRMLFIVICHGLLIALTISSINYAKQYEKTEKRREKLESTIKKLAQKVAEAANDPQQKVSLETMKQYVQSVDSIDHQSQALVAKSNAKVKIYEHNHHLQQAYGILRDIDNGNARDDTSSLTEECFQ